MRNCLVYYADVRELERYTNVTIDLESRIYSSSKIYQLEKGVGRVTQRTYITVIEEGSERK